MNDETKDKQVVAADDRYDDGFSDSTPTGRTIQGSFLKFAEGKWTESGVPVPVSLKLWTIETTTVIQRWKDQRVIEEISERPLSDVNELNAAVPQEEWERDRNGKPKPPYQLTAILYLLNPETMEKYTFPTSTVGGSIAVSELKDSVAFMRRYRGESTLAVVELSSKLMRTQYGDRLRPFFKILEWRAPSGGAASLPPAQNTTPPAIAAPTTAPSLPSKKVEEPTRREMLGDEVPY
jgi:hypothetical protein